MQIYKLFIKKTNLYAEKTILLSSKILLAIDLKIILLNFKNNEKCCNKFWYSSN